MTPRPTVLGVKLRRSHGMWSGSLGRVRLCVSEDSCGFWKGTAWRRGSDYGVHAMREHTPNQAAYNLDRALRGLGMKERER